MVTCGRAPTEEYSLVPLPQLSMPPYCGHSQSSPPLKPTGRSCLGSYEVTALPCISVHVKPCVEFHTGWSSVFPSSIEFLQSNPAGLQIKCSGAFPFDARHPEQEPDVGLRNITPVGEPLHKLFSSFYVTQPTSMGI